MVVDTSALIAIFFEEPEAKSFAQLISESDAPRISVVSRLELAMVLERHGDPNSDRLAENYLRNASIVEEPVTLEQGSLARQAFHDFGRGRHKARLNFGDCFSYALAKALREPLLYKGTDFSATDISSARRSG